MIVKFCAPYPHWRKIRTEYVAPSVVIQILTGIALGPGVFGTWQPEVFHLAFNPEAIQLLNGIAMWAVMILVWTAGIELNLHGVWRTRGQSITVASLLLVAPLLFGPFVALGLLQWDDWKGAGARDWQFVLGIGIACAVPALPIFMLLLEKLGILKTALGQRVLPYYSLDEIAIWATLALILMDWRRLGMQMLFLLGFTIASFCCGRGLMARVPERERLYITLI